MRLVLKTKQEIKDYYFGYVTRLADELGAAKYKEVYEWACKTRTIEEYKEKVADLEWELAIGEAARRM